MNDRAKLLKVTAIITSFVITLSFMLLLIFSVIDEFTILPYIFLVISIVPCGVLWKMYINEKKYKGKGV